MDNFDDMMNKITAVFIDLQRFYLKLKEENKIKDNEHFIINHGVSLIYKLNKISDNSYKLNVLNCDSKTNRNN